MISWTDMAPPGTDLSGRFLLYYTGYTRRAKDILHAIVRRYLDGEPEALELVAHNRLLARQMKDTLDRRDLEAFGQAIREVWETQKKLDPGVTDDRIESILDRIAPFIVGAKLAGAGGGGFLFIVTRGATETQRVRDLLTDQPPNDRARFFDFEVDPGGLKVSVL